MKGFGRAFEINCLFLFVVALLVALQLVLQRSHRKDLLLQLKERGEEGVGDVGRQHEEALPLAVPLHLPSPSIPPPDDSKAFLRDAGLGGEGGVDVRDGGVGGEGNMAAPIVPNILRSFPKRKAPYVRKAKNKKKKKNRKGKQQQREMRGEGGGGGRGGGLGRRGDNMNDKTQQKGNKQKKGRMGDRAKIQG